MVVLASASDHRHRRAAKSSRPASTPSSKAPAEKQPSGGASLLHPFNFTWGAQRRLRCSKDGAPVYASASTSPTPLQHNPLPDKEKEESPKPPSSARPQRPRNLRPLRYAASRPDAAGNHQAAPPLQPPNKPAPRKRGFAVALAPDEIAHDFAAIRRCATAPRPAPPARGRSKKRPKAVQNAIDAMCPGLALLDIDLDNYKIEERGQKR